MRLVFEHKGQCFLVSTGTLFKTNLAQINTKCRYACFLQSQMFVGDIYTCCCYSSSSSLKAEDTFELILCVYIRYNARLAYCKTVAVMSVVGYILGLGDRHGENILFDSTSGDCVHVDFNCLFNRVIHRINIHNI